METLMLWGAGSLAYIFVGLGFFLEARDPRADREERIIILILTILWPLALAIRIGVGIAR